MYTWKTNQKKTFAIINSTKKQLLDKGHFICDAFLNIILQIQKIMINYIEETPNSMYHGGGRGAVSGSKST